MESVKIAKINNFCHDCGKEITIEDGEIRDGAFLVYDDAGEKINVLKCSGCFAKSIALSNFRKCEVYSRVVGYLRPVDQWHRGKRQEYKERQEYVMRGGEDCC